MIGNATVMGQAAHDTCSTIRPGAATGAKVVLHTRVVTATGGGPDKTILNSGRFLENSGYSSICAYMHPPDDPGFVAIQRRADAARARLVSVPDRGVWDTHVLKRLLAICRAEDVSIWHAHDYKSNAIGLLLRRFHPMTLVTTVHGWVRHTKRTPLYYWLDRRCLSRYDHVICVSDDQRDVCRRVGVRPERLSLVHNAIDIDQFRRESTTATAKRALNCPSDQILIGAVGRLSDEKGFDRLIRATTELVRAGLPIQTVIAGEGDARHRLQALIDELNASQYVRLLGFRSDIKQLFEALDVFALTSLREGLPNVVLEAMTMSVPVISTRVAGIPELIQDGQNGIVIPLDDQNALVEGLRRLVGDASLRSRLAQNARRTIEQHFSFRERMAKIARIYDGLQPVGPR